MARFLTSASTEFEAEMIRERLSQAGIGVVIQGAGNPRAFDGGRHDVYVEDGDLEQARQALAQARGE